MKRANFLRNKRKRQMKALSQVNRRIKAYQHESDRGNGRAAKQLKVAKQEQSALMSAIKPGR